MRLPDEARTELECSEKVWELLARWLTPDQADLVRHTIYNFRSLVERWHEVGSIPREQDAAGPPMVGVVL